MEGRKGKEGWNGRKNISEENDKYFHRKDSSCVFFSTLYLATERKQKRRTGKCRKGEGKERVRKGRKGGKRGRQEGKEKEGSNRRREGIEKKGKGKKREQRK